ncbi:hypothetical protein [Streptomyces sp. KLOTTS4A1]|uniref:hypothetical protein n=1 Tax=Streptomyces sp. KLOTTS4A1 TaxID=3390996 RepID=UPI0039F54DAF
MSAQLYPAARELAKVLWPHHTLYRERDGGMVIRGDSVQRWISLGVAGTRGDVRIRAGLILDGGTTAPARTETVLPLASGTPELAAACRRLLADLTSAAEPPTPDVPDDSRSRRSRKPGKPGKPWKSGKPGKPGKSGRSRTAQKPPRPPKPRRSRGRRAMVWALGVTAVSAVTVYALFAYTAATGG